MPAPVAALFVSLIVALRYVALSGGLAWLTRKRGRARPFRPAQIVAEIRWSLLSAAIYGVPAGLAYWAWNRHGLTRLYADPRAYPLWWLPVSVLVYLFLQDSWFYWTHRAMHGPRLFRLAHAVHHKSRPPTAWSAMSFHPWEALSGSILVPALAFVIPIHLGALGVVLLVASVMGTTNHMGWEMLPVRLVRGPIGQAIISGAHHEVHHRDYRANYGLYFRFWDRLCGTDKGVDEAMLLSG